MKIKMKVLRMKNYLKLVLAVFVLFGNYCYAQQQEENNCNSNTPGWGESLGVVTFASEQTWKIGDQEWSDVVQATNCNKEAYNAGSAGNFNADCRSNPGQRGNLFSWCAVARFAETLCPDGWRVPTKDDFIALNIALGGTGLNRQNSAELRDRHLKEWGGAFGGRTSGNGTLAYQDVNALYWTQSQQGADTGFSYSVMENGNSSPQGWNNKSQGFSVRCVR